VLDTKDPKVKSIIERKIADGEFKPEHIKTEDPSDQLIVNIEAAATWEELKDVLLGKNSKARVKGESK